MRLLKAFLFFIFWVHPALAQAQETAPDPLVMAFSSLPPFMQTDADGGRSGFSVDLAEMIGAEIGVSVEFLDMPTVQDAVAAQATGRVQFFAGVVKLPALAQTNVFSDPVATERLLFTVLEENRDSFANGKVQNRRIGVLNTDLGSDEPILAHNVRVEFVNAQTALVSLLSGSVDALLIPPTVLYKLAHDAAVDGRLAFVGEPLQETTRHVTLHESRAELLEPINQAIWRLEADGRLEVLRQSYGVEVPPPAPDVLTVGVTNFGNYTIVNDDGSFGGFAVETLKELAELAHLDLRFIPLTSDEWSAGPGAGRFDMLPQISINAERALRMDFTLPTERSAFGIFMRAGEADGVRGLNDLLDRTVAVQRVSRSNREAQNAGLTKLVAYENLEEIVAALQREEVEAFLYSVGAVEALLRKQGLVNQIEMVEPAYLQVDRAIALRFGLGAVRSRLNAVIPGYLISDEYAALRQEYFGKPVFWTQMRIYAALAALAALILGLLGYLFWQRQRQRHQREEFERQKAKLALEQEHSEELGKLITDLERSNRDLDDFAYIASHDLKEPLRGIGINANFLLREELTGKAGERVLRMNELTRRMEQLITDLLFFSRLGQGDGPRIFVEPKVIIDAIRSDLTEWLDEHGAEIIEIGDIPALKAKRVKVKVVLQNLIVNGIKYNDSEEKRIEIGFVRSVEVNGQDLKNAIFLRDNGIGIGEEHRDKIFRIFSRLNKDADYGRGTGTGSGLAFVRKIVEEHGGVVDYTSEVGKGSTFYVTFPLADTPT